MLTASDSKAALTLVTSAAVNTVTALLGRASGSAEQKRALLLDGVPEVIAYYSAGSSALAADFYDDERERGAAEAYIAADNYRPYGEDSSGCCLGVRSAVRWLSRYYCGAAC
jgi:hypothetical protein